MGSVRIRHATTADIVAVLDFWQTHDDQGGGATNDAASIEALLATDAEALLVAEDDAPASGIIGTVVVAWDGWRGGMYRLITHRQRRGQGIARSLVTAGEAQLRKRGARRVHIIVDRDNDAGRAVWPSFGYASADARSMRFVKMLA